MKLPVPIYGVQVRDWTYVDDHCAGIEAVLARGEPGHAYNVGGGNPRTNLQVTHAILAHCGRSPELVRHVTDRKAHDRRYALECGKLHALGWRPHHDFDRALAATEHWYRGHEAWWRAIRGSKDFADHPLSPYLHSLRDGGWESHRGFTLDGHEHQHDDEQHDEDPAAEGDQ
jgi:dTDP-glucose 4,6-dehydratase